MASKNESKRNFKGLTILPPGSKSFKTTELASPPRKQEQELEQEPNRDIKSTSPRQSRWIDAKGCIHVFPPIPPSPSALPIPKLVRSSQHPPKQASLLMGKLPSPTSRSAPIPKHKSLAKPTRAGTKEGIAKMDRASKHGMIKDNEEVDVDYFVDYFGGNNKAGAGKNGGQRSCLVALPTGLDLGLPTSPTNPFANKSLAAFLTDPFADVRVASSTSINNPFDDRNEIAFPTGINPLDNHNEIAAPTERDQYLDLEEEKEEVGVRPVSYDAFGIWWSHQPQNILEGSTKTRSSSGSLKTKDDDEDSALSLKFVIGGDSEDTLDDDIDCPYHGFGKGVRDSDFTCDSGSIAVIEPEAASDAKDNSTAYAPKMPCFRRETRGEEESSSTASSAKLSRFFPGTRERGIVVEKSEAPLARLGATDSTEPLISKESKDHTSSHQEDDDAEKVDIGHRRPSRARFYKRLSNLAAAMAENVLNQNRPNEQVARPLPEHIKALLQSYPLLAIPRPPHGLRLSASAAAEAQPIRLERTAVNLAFEREFGVKRTVSLSERPKESGEDRDSVVSGLPSLENSNMGWFVNWIGKGVRRGGHPVSRHSKGDTNCCQREVQASSSISRIFDIDDHEVRFNLTTNTEERKWLYSAREKMIKLPHDIGRCMALIDGLLKAKAYASAISVIKVARNRYKELQAINVVYQSKLQSNLLPTSLPSPTHRHQLKIDWVKRGRKEYPVYIGSKDFENKVWKYKWDRPSFENGDDYRDLHFPARNSTLWETYAKRLSHADSNHFRKLHSRLLSWGCHHEIKKAQKLAYNNDKETWIQLFHEPLSKYMERWRWEQSIALANLYPLRHNWNHVDMQNYALALINRRPFPRYPIPDPSPHPDFLKVLQNLGQDRARPPPPRYFPGITPPAEMMDSITDEDVEAAYHKPQTPGDEMEKDIFFTRIEEIQDLNAMKWFNIERHWDTDMVSLAVLGPCTTSVPDQEPPFEHKNPEPHLNHWDEPDDRSIEEKRTEAYKLLIGDIPEFAPRFNNVIRRGRREERRPFPWLGTAEFLN